MTENKISIRRKPAYYLLLEFIFVADGVQATGIKNDIKFRFRVPVQKIGVYQIHSDTLCVCELTRHLQRFRNEIQSCYLKSGLGHVD
jgi:hypothetical protein